MTTQKKKKALITGITGQDGAFLAQHLLDLGYEVHGGARRSASGSTWRMEKLGIASRVKVIDFDLLDHELVTVTIRDNQYDEIYNLAAQSFVGSSFNMPESTMATNGNAVLTMCEAIRRYSKDTKMYQAGTSEMFGKVAETPQSERTPFYPRSPYGIAKLMAHWTMINYRESYNLFLCNGILFNHESFLRGKEFVTKKIADYVRTLERQTEPLRLGNIYAKRDWGYAGDYVKAMHLMLQQEQPEDYVIATGETHTVKDFINAAFESIGKKISWNGSGVDEVGIVDSRVAVVIDPQFYRPAEVEILQGDARKARRVLKWKPEMSFTDLIVQMVARD